jgi:protein-disulfide isomerase
VAVLKAPVTSSDHIHGAENAPVTLVEYGDYECPYCGLAHPIVRRVQEHFGRQVRFVFRHFPLTEVHPHAGPAAETAEYAGAHRRFREMHDGLYENQDRLDMPLLFGLVASLGLSQAGLRLALMSRTFAPKVQSDFLGGVRSGVKGTRPSSSTDGGTTVLSTSRISSRR